MGAANTVLPGVSMIRLGNDQSRTELFFVASIAIRLFRFIEADLNIRARANTVRGLAEISIELDQITHNIKQERLGITMDLIGPHNAGRQRKEMEILVLSAQ